MIDLFSKRNKKPSTGQLVYDDLPQPLKTQIVLILREPFDYLPDIMFLGIESSFDELARILRKENGVFQLTQHAQTREQEIFNYFLQEHRTEKCLDFIEIVFDYLMRAAQSSPYASPDLFNRIRQAVIEINDRFKEHSIGYEFKEGKIIRVDSGFLHAEAVVPAMTLLHDSAFAGANQEFLRAHDHFRHGRFPEAMNECLKAFESTMKTICHKQRWNYNQTDTASKLMTICIENGLFPPHMQNSLSGLRSALEAVATVRNKMSGHGQGVQQVQITEETAAFMIHSTASNILYLVSLDKLK